MSARLTAALLLCAFAWHTESARTDIEKTTLALTRDVEPEKDAASVNIEGCSTSTYRIVKEGEGETTAHKGDTLVLDVVSKCANNACAEWWNTKSYEMIAGNGRSILGMDQGVIGMKKGETRFLVVGPECGFGSDGLSAHGIPGGATIEMTLEAIRVTSDMRGKCMNFSTAW